MTANDFSARIDAYLRALQLPAILSDLGAKLARSADAEAAGIGQVALAAATGAQTDTARLSEILRAALTYISQIETSVTAVSAAGPHTGTVSQSFTGGPGTYHTTGVSMATATANGYGVAWCTNPPDGGGMGDVGGLIATCLSFTAGVGFTLGMFQPSYVTVPNASYSFRWVAYD